MKEINNNNKTTKKQSDINSEIDNFNLTSFELFMFCFIVALLLAFFKTGGL